MADYDVESFISKIIDSTETTWSPQEKIPLIMKEIEHLKSDTRTFLHNYCDYDIEGILSESTELCAESEALVKDMEECKKEIEQETMAEILKSIENHDQIAKELKSVNFALNIVSNVITCGRFLKDFEEGREAKSFSKAVESVYDLLQFIEQPADGFREMQLYASIKNTANIIMDSLVHDLTKEWNQMVSYAVAPGPPGHVPEKSTVSINITLDDSPLSMDVVNALDKSTKLMDRLKEFAYFLKTETFIPILRYDSMIYTKSEDSILMTISHEANFTPMYEDTLSNLKVLFHFLNNKFNIPYNDDKTIMRVLGELLSEEFCEMMINDCCINTIPCNINSLQNYGRVTNQIKDFEHLLRVINFFPEQGLTLLKYMENIDVLFAEQSSQHYLKTARTVMFKDLSVTMSIGVEKIQEEFIPQDDIPEDINIMEALDVFAEVFPNSLFYFPRCMISRSAQELLDLVYIIMEQAVQCPDVVCKKLYCTVRLIFELYDAVVPYHHENYLETIPQYVALFHNNCMYLAHNLQTLGDKWLCLMEGREVNYPISFVDLVQKIRDLGYKHLTMHMQQQRKQILDNIRSSDLNCIVVKDVLGDNAEAAVRQCLRQLQLLKNVWIGVFPSNVFKRLMATLINMFVDELIHRVCTVEDISMEMATQLTEIYTLVVQKTPQLFQNMNDVKQHVKSWVKLQELIFVLGGSLKDIERHWNDGTGPLAVHFHIDELRSLIKALFQNTQFRANLLSKIK